MFDFKKKYILENDFVKLSPLKKKHLRGLQQISDDPIIWKYLFEKGRKKKDLKAYIKKAIQNRKFGKEYPFVIFDKKNKSIAGTTRIYDVNSNWKTLKIGHTWYGEKFRGSGLNHYCKYLLFDFIFEKLKMERIGFGVHDENIISIKALEKIGCQQEGELRNFLPKVDGNGRADILLYSILKNEWRREYKIKDKVKSTKYL